MRRLRRHLKIIVAFAAAALNVLAPVFAYAIGQPLHELQRGVPGAGAPAVLSSPVVQHRGMAQQDPADGARTMHHGDGHAMHHAVLHAMQHDGAHALQDAATPDEPAAPHCPYCLDFAAGVALGGALPVVPGAQPGHPPLPRYAPALVFARASLRLAPSRGPPALA